jgi:phytoene dehydrogenase-like protein
VLRAPDAAFAAENLVAEQRYDALVIGAGLSGLAAGIRLAMFGKRVAVLEKHYLWGGLNSFYKRGGRLFDTGLHALTNYVHKSVSGKPLTRVCRQLRIPWDALELVEQDHACVVSDGAVLRFTNRIAETIDAVGELMPHKKDAFAALVADLAARPLGEEAEPEASARTILMERLGDPLLVDLLLIPCCWYGSARENDVDWDQFVILFHSIFLEGLALPKGGVRPLLALFKQRLADAGGELERNAEVVRILSKDGSATGVELADGRVLAADVVLSSAGRVETQRLVDPAHPVPLDSPLRGRLSFVETISVLSKDPRELSGGNEHCKTAGVVFFSNRRPFRYERPAGAVDLASGVISLPQNFPGVRVGEEPLLRVTCLANHDAWTGIDGARYDAMKREASDGALAAATAFCPDVRPFEVFRDVFTPTTVVRYTGHHAGTVYGSPKKVRDGRTSLAGLHLIGTDQGYLGIVGAAMSGISMANRHVLAAAGATTPTP